MGRRIRAREVRVIDHEGAQRGIMPTSDAMDIAQAAGLQLVEVNPKANPPVCKIMDYGKYKYETSKREREAKKHQKTLELKEVKFRPKTHGHDFDFKVRHVRRFLEDGDKVKLVVQFRGREVIHPETGKDILDRVCKNVADLATIVQMTSMEGNRMNMVLGPKAGKQQPKPRPKPPTAAAPRPRDGDGEAEAEADAEPKETEAAQAPPVQEAPPPEPAEAVADPS
ncbi:MAG: translation initiation factor IF-3 [Myxococcales bacterium]|nr:translation initiation factor IF-3 [Myxococcales bacterium]